MSLKKEKECDDTKKMHSVLKKSVIGFFVLATVFGTSISGVSASAVNKVKGEPIYIMTSKEMEKQKKFDKNFIYIEKMECIIEDKKGNGHLIGDPNYGIYFGKYKGKYPKKGSKTKTYFLHEFLYEGGYYNAFIARYDYLRIKTKNGKWKWVMTDANGFE